MKTDKVTRALLAVSIIATIFDLARLDIWGTTGLLYLVWNLCLAWVPYIISRYFIKKETPLDRFVPLFILWLLFFPNAPYLVTDVLHLASSTPSAMWYDSLLFFFFGWIGLFLGMFSLFQIHQYFKAHLTYLVSEFSILAICFVSSFGVYLGRFERFNSWDAFVNPVELTRHSFNISSGLFHGRVSLLFVVVFTIFIYSVYKTVQVLIEDKVA